MQGINTLYKSRYENEVMTLFEELLYEFKTGIFHWYGYILPQKKELSK